MQKLARSLQLTIAAFLLFFCSHGPATTNDDSPLFPADKVGSALVQISAWREFIFYEQSRGVRQVGFSPEQGRSATLSIKGTGFLIGEKGLMVASEYVAGIGGAVHNFCGLMEKAGSRARLDQVTVYVEAKTNEAQSYRYFIKQSATKHSDLCSGQGRSLVEILPMDDVSNIVFDPVSNLFLAKLPPNKRPNAHLNLAADEPAIGTWGFCALPTDIPGQRFPPQKISNIIKGDKLSLIEFEGKTPIGSSGSPLIDRHGDVLGVISYTNPEKNRSTAISAHTIRQLLEDKGIDYP